MKSIKFFETVIVAILTIVQLGIAGNVYYRAYSDIIQLNEDRSAMMIEFTDISEAVGQLNLLTPPDIQKIEIYEAHNIATIEFPTVQNVGVDDLISQVGFNTQVVRSVQFGYKMNDGYQMFVTRDIVLHLKDGVTFNTILPIIENSYSKIDSSRSNTIVITVQDINNVFDLSEAIYASGLVEWCHPDFISEIQLYNDPLYSEQYYLNNVGQNIDGSPGTSDIDIDAPETWDVNMSPEDIIVGVIDQGIENHNEFYDNSGVSRILNGYPDDDYGGGRPDDSGDNHGVACAGIIAASHNDLGIKGVAPGVKLLPVNIWANGIESAQDIADAINWAWQNGADVLSNSWGYRTCQENLYPTIVQAIENARVEGRDSLGSVVVFAAGNNYSDCVDFPANTDGVLAVGAIDKDGILWDYSAHGSRLDIVAPSGDVNLNGDVRTTDRTGEAGYNSSDYMPNFGGTSAACPQAAGTAALLLSVGDELTESEVVDVIKTTATDMGSSGFDNTFGCGRLNAFDALNGVIELISLKNRFIPDESNLGGAISLDNTETPRIEFPEILSNDESQLAVKTGPVYKATTLQPRLGNGNQFKHLKWDTPSEYLLETEQIFEEGDNELTGWFSTQDNISIVSTQPVEIQVHDPWYAYQENGNWVQPDDFRPLSEQGDGNGNVQVFVNQNQSFDPDLPIYRLKAPKYYATTDAIYAFSQWTGANGDVAFDASGAYTTAARQTDVVFLTANATVTAEYTPVNQIENYTLTITPEDTLAIPAGANITFAPLFHFEVHGSFSVNGTADNKVKLGMASAPDNPFTAFYINVHNDCDYFTMDYTTFDYGTMDFRYDTGNSNLVHRWINHCVFNNSVNGLNDHNNSSIPVDIRFINNTIWNNTTTPTSLVFSHDYPIIQNNILVNTTMDVNCQIGAGGFIYNLIDNSTVNNYSPNTTNLFRSPLLSDPSNGDFGLQSNSPCINAGNPDSPHDPDGTRSDIGAYYYPQLSGDITQDITLSGEVAFQSDVTVAQTAAMTLEPGTRMLIEPGAKLTVNGALIVNGTALEPVVLDCNTQGSSWSGIEVDGGHIEFTHGEVQNTNLPGIGVRGGGTGFIKDSHIHDCTVGIRLNRADNDFRIENNQVDHNAIGINVITTSPSITSNTLHNNQYYGLALLSGANPVVKDNDIHHNGDGGFHSAGILMFGSSPILTQAYPVMTYTDPSAYPVNNRIHDNLNKGVYITYSGQPDFGLYEEVSGRIYGGFNYFHDNVIHSIYRNDHSTDQAADPPSPLNQDQILAQANYWYGDKGNGDGPIDSYGPFFYSPTAPEVLDNASNNYDPLLTEGLVKEQETLYLDAIDRYEQYLNTNPPKNEAMIALSGIDRCKTKLKQVDEWRVELEDIAQNFPKEETKELAQNYLIWVYKKLNMDAEAIAMAESLTEPYVGTAWEDYYTMEIAMLTEETNGAILMKTGNEEESVQMKARQAKDRLLSEGKHSEAAEIYRLLFGTGSGPTTSKAAIPLTYALHPAYPNPFNPVTTLSYALPTDSHTQLVIYDLRGRVVRTLVNREETAGQKTIRWDGRNNQGIPVASGVYLYSLTANALNSDTRFTAHRKLVLLK